MANEKNEKRVFELTERERDKVMTGIHALSKSYERAINSNRHESVKNAYQQLKDEVDQLQRKFL